MTVSVCFSCGVDKSAPFTQCPECGAVPQGEEELARALALSGHLHAPHQLAVLAEDIRAHRKLAFRSGVLDQAREAVRDPQLVAMLGTPRGGAGAKVQPRPSASGSGALPRSSPAPAIQSASKPAGGPQTPQRTEPQGATARKFRVRRDAPELTALDRTSFGILGATTRDDPRRIVELAEEASLSGDSEACARARADLTNLPKRLAAEVAWLAGISPRRVHAYRVLLKHDIDAYLSYAVQEAPLVQANLIAAAIDRFDPELNMKDWTEWVCMLAEMVEEIHLPHVLKTINEDRLVAGFPEVQSVDQLEKELVAQRRRLAEVVQEALDRLPTQRMIEMVTSIVEQATDARAGDVPSLVDDVINRFAGGVYGFLEKEAENVRTLIKRAAESAPQGEELVRPVVDKLDLVVRNWARVAHPIHVCKKAQAAEHEQSNVLAGEIRSLGVALCNKHGMLVQAERLIKLLQEIFADMPKIADLVGEDAEAIQGLLKGREEAKRRTEDWAREITFHAEIGLLFKDTLRISPSGVEWKGRLYPLESIALLGWGATRHSVNGVPTGTEYSIRLFTKNDSVTIETKREDVYSGFVDRLWKAVGARLLTEMLEGLREGKQYQFGDALVHDRGVVLTRRRTFLEDETARLDWGQLLAWSGNGFFCLAPAGAKKAYVMLSYQEANNAHLLDAAIRMKLKNRSDRLSSILE